MKQTLLLLLAFICINAKAIVTEPVITLKSDKSYELLYFNLKAKTDNTKIQIGFGSELWDFTINTTETQAYAFPASGETIYIYGSGITMFNCAQRQINSLDVSKCTELTELWCQNNNLSSIDLSNNTNLVSFYAGANNLLALDVSNLHQLQNLYISNNKLSTINVSSNTELVNLVLGDNNFSSINISNNLKLKYFNCRNISLSTLDISNATELDELVVYNCHLSSINLTNNHKLINLACGDNNFTQLDLSHCPSLRYLDCFNNRLEMLDVSMNHDLEMISCSDNLISTLDASQTPSLYFLQCENNKFSFSTLPIPNSTMSTYQYAAQLDFDIPTTISLNKPFDLISQYSINGNTTSYTWKTESGSTLVAGTDYTINNGITTFKTIPNEKVYCEMTNATFPDLSGANALKTTLTTITLATGVDNNEMDQVSIYTRQQTVYLNLPQAAMVEVYDITGHKIKDEFMNSGNNSFEVAQKGIYVVKVNINNQWMSQKIVIK